MFDVKEKLKKQGIESLKSFEDEKGEQLSEKEKEIVEGMRDHLENDEPMKAVELASKLDGIDLGDVM